MIPSRYSTSLAPLSSPTLRRNVLREGYLAPRASDGGGGTAGYGAGAGTQGKGFTQAFETPYVVRSVRGSMVTGDVDTGWEWEHPRPRGGGEEDREEKFTRVRFDLREAKDSWRFHSGYPEVIGGGLLEEEEAEKNVNVNVNSNSNSNNDSNNDSNSNNDNDDKVTIHGLLGFFHSVLYKESGTGYSHVISISPRTFSVNMFSWFPLFFPFKVPLTVSTSQEELVVDMWRCVDKEEDEGEGERVSRVWYEWSGEVVRGGEVTGTAGGIHNPLGRSWSIMC